MQPNAPIGQTRFEQFSDGVFAIAITLLAIELRVPTFSHTTIKNSLADVVPLLPTILTFVLSFVSIAIFWVNHHRLTQHMSMITRRILWSNVLLLMFTTLIPFATALVASNPTQPMSVLVYSFVFLGASLSFSLVHFFIHKCNGTHWKLFRRSMIGPVCYLIAVVSAPLSVNLSYAFLIIPPLFYFLPRR
jgi:uncharacterized membrane protein